MTFRAWLAEVDKVVAEYTFDELGWQDLADQTWYDWWQSEMDPREAAEIALADEGFPFEEMGYE